SATGDTVPAFTTGMLMMPSPLTVMGPANAATILRSEPLTIAWMPSPGIAYINLSQTPGPNPYPSAFKVTIRCEVSAHAGTFAVPPDLVAVLEAGANASFSVGGLVTDTQAVGDYEVIFRLLAVDTIRSLGVQ